MKRPARASMILVAAFLAAASSAVSAQSLLPKKIWQLTISVNVPGAAIYVDNALIQGSTTSVAGGAHNVKVLAPGYFDFNGPVAVNSDQTFTVVLQPRVFPVTLNVNVPGAVVTVDGARVAPGTLNLGFGNHVVQATAAGYQDYQVTLNVSGAITFNVNLQPQLFPVTIRVNVPGAIVTVDGARIASGTANLAPGAHTLQVTADGYQGYTGTLNVSAAATIAVNLNALTYMLTVNSNVREAGVVVNNVAKGGVPYTEQLPPGTYTVTVSAKGYADFVTGITLDRPTTVNAVLQRAAATISILVTPGFLDPDAKPRDALGLLKVFVDGKLANPQKETERISIPSGTHKIRIVSGGLSFPLDDFNFQGGANYALELSLGIKVKPTQ